MVWDAKNSAEVLALRGHTETVRTASFSATLNDTARSRAASCSLAATSGSRVTVVRTEAS